MLRTGHGREVLDALASTRDMRWLISSKEGASLARLELTLWDMGAAGASHAPFGAWLWRGDIAFSYLVLDAARRTLRHRSLASRVLAIGADGLPRIGVAAQRLAETARVAQYLFTHPTGVVWVPAARALGRLSVRLPAARAFIWESLHGGPAKDKRRAVTAVASMPEEAGSEVARLVDDVVVSGDPWMVASIGAAAPTFAREHRKLWQKFVDYLQGSKVPVEVLWSVADGLMGLRRRGPLDRESLRAVEALRAHAATAAPRSASVAQQWAHIDHALGFMIGDVKARRDSETVLEALVQQGLSGDPQEAAARATRVHKKIETTLAGTWRDACRAEDPVERGHLLGMVESLVRTSAIALWDPLSDLAGVQRPAPVDLEPLLGEVESTLRASKVEYTTLRTAIRVLAHMVDRTDTPSQTEVSSARGRAAARALALLGVASTKTIKKVEKPAAGLLWRALARSGRGKTSGGHAAERGIEHAVRCLVGRGRAEGHPPPADRPGRWTTWAGRDGHQTRDLPSGVPRGQGAGHARRSLGGPRRGTPPVAGCIGYQHRKSPVAVGRRTTARSPVDGAP